MKHTLLLAYLVSCIFLSACQSSSNGSTVTYDIGLVESKKITLPIDENTYYESKAIFPFEKDGKEYLHFLNALKRQYEIIIYDMTSGEMSKRIQLHKQGPDGVPAVMASKPFIDGMNSLLYQTNVGRITLLSDEGKVLRNYPIVSPEGHFMAFLPCSYFYTPTFVKDSVLFVAPKISKSSIKKEEWVTIPMFFGLNLNTGKIDYLPINYPPIFDHDVKRMADGAAFSYDYNHAHNRLVCSFVSYDSIMVSSDLNSVKWYNGKSRYLKSKKPRLIEVGEGMQELVETKEEGHYFHIMYDKFRDVYYRFVEHPCELGEDEGYMDNPKAREFSVIIFDKDFRIIGETKFPGNKYHNKMSFVGRDGLYISENNLANPDFDEDKLVFACFKLENSKENN